MWTTGSLWVLNEAIHVNWLEECLGHSKCSINISQQYDDGDGAAAADDRDFVHSTPTHWVYET